MARNITMTPAAGLFSKPVRNAHDAHEVHEVQEVHEVTNSSKMPHTQGRKGKRLPRINMAFTLENYEFLRVHSRINGLTMTEYVNSLIEKDSQEVENGTRK